MHNKEFKSLFLMVVFACACLLLDGGLANAKTVYEGQPPMTNKELLSFIELLPRFRSWAASNEDKTAPSINEGKADFMYSAKAAEWVKARGWEPDRFFAIMGRAAAALFIVAEGNEMKNEKPSDMPVVSKSELELVRQNLAALLQAGSDAPPINQ